MIARTLRSSYFKTNSGTNTHYLQAGDPSGPLLICLHGLGGSTETFSPLVPSLPPTYNIILVDFPGYGKTTLASVTKPLSVEGLVVDLADLITSFQGSSNSSASSKVVIVGHSLGAIIALQYAARHPQPPAGLLLLGPGRAAGHIPAVRQRMLDLAAAVRKEGIRYAADIAAKSNFYDDSQDRTVNLAAREAVRLDVSSADPEAYAQTCEAIVDSSHKDPQYQAITCPVVFVAGDKDMISPVQRSQDISTLVGGRSWVHVVKSGHQPILEDLPGVEKAVQQLMEAIVE
ncbi:hypothetical protein J4E91_009358 [Alternaria rosae]|nr:hypothetical protein J4E91_009358 [Alternaria rosae]